jgi:hypothetical protein
MPHYPEQRFLSKLAIIRRRVTLPESIVGVVDVAPDKRVDLREVVAYGVAPSHHVIVDAVKFFRLRNPENLLSLLKVEVDDRVDELTVLAGKNVERGKRLYSPVEGRVVNISDGRIIIEAEPEMIKLEAGVRGRVISVQAGRGVTIETVGGQIQGVWGNGHRSIATMRFAPEPGGIEQLSRQFEVEFMGAIVAVKSPLTADDLNLIEEMNLVGVIAPGMHYGLIEHARRFPKPIMLTEGFGVEPMSHLMQTLLGEIEGQQITLDAFEPKAGDTRRPEVIVNVQPKVGDTPSRINIMLTLKPGTLVRLTREPYAGQSAQIINLPKSPVLLDNGLRVSCAEVELVGGNRVKVPLANIELIAR